MLTVSDGYALVPFVCMLLPCYSKAKQGNNYGASYVKEESDR